MSKFNAGDDVIYDRGLLAETAGYKRLVKAKIIMSVDEKCWIEWNENVNGKTKKRSAQVGAKSLRLLSPDLCENNLWP
ncbi:MAG: hypothetical protein ACE5I1_13260 [bacterium]